MQSANILLQPGVMPRLLQGLWVTIWLAAVSVALSVPVGLVTGWLMTLHNPVIRVIMRIYLDFIRIMPQLALLFIAFYGLARAWNWNLDATGACVFVFVLWGGAELGDLVRGALESIPAIQYESSYMLGLSNWQTFTHVILPQAAACLGEPGHAHRQDHVVGHPARRGRSDQSGPADHRRAPLRLPGRHTVGLWRDLRDVFCGVLAAFDGSTVSGKEVGE